MIKKNSQTKPSFNLKAPLSFVNRGLVLEVIPMRISSKATCKSKIWNSHCSCRLDKFWWKVPWPWTRFFLRSLPTLFCTLMCPKLALLGEAFDTFCSLWNHRRHQTLVPSEFPYQKYHRSVSSPKEITFLAAQKLVGVQKKLNPLFEICLWKAAMGLAGHLNDISFSTASSHCENLPEPGLFQRICEFPIKENKA